MDRIYKSLGFTFTFWSLFGVFLGLVIGLGTGEMLLALSIGAIFGVGLGILITRHIKRKHLI